MGPQQPKNSGPMDRLPSALQAWSTQPTPGPGPRGSLYRLLHKPGAREELDDRRRLSMAYDVANGMNYLHRRSPPIVHRDLKSPNLLVDKKIYSEVIGIFIFTSAKGNVDIVTYVKCANKLTVDKGYNRILWELATLQQPWGNLNPAQLCLAIVDDLGPTNNKVASGIFLGYKYN
ncbi:hypothetical protein V6N13_059782 [Hibiscus sabdariffa]